MIKLVALILTLSSAAVVAREAPLSAWNGGAKGSSSRTGVVVTAPVVVSAPVVVGAPVVVSAPVVGTAPEFVVKAPEIDAASMASALTLLLGGVMVMRSRATKR